MNWILRTFGVIFNSVGIWWNDRTGSTHLWKWPWYKPIKED